jgi:hypothetical protein
MPMQHQPSLYVRFCLSMAAVLIGSQLAMGAPPVDADGRPLIRKLGTVECDLVESSPFVFHGKLHLLASACVGADARGPGDSAWTSCIENLATGKKTSVPICGGFANAFVEGKIVYVTMSDTSHGKVFMQSTGDLEHWDRWTVFDLPDHTIFNTSICRADDKYVLMYEVGEPKEEAGVPFTARFATSKDLKHWTVTPPECNYAKDRYTAPHCLRFLDGYYYDFYLESMQSFGRPRGFETYVVRSKDLIHWEQSALNPVLRASEDDRKLRNAGFTPQQRERIAKATNCNNSDIDMCEYQGRLVIFYSWGDQLTREHLAEAVYEGSLSDFLRGWFPKR